MSKKINYNTLNQETISNMSEYHVAYKKLAELREQYRNDRDKIQSAINKKIADRDKELKRGSITADEAAEKYDVADLNRQLAALREQNRKDCKPWQESMRSSQKDLCPEYLFKGYELTMNKGEMTHLNKACQKYLETIGATNPGGTAVSKFATQLAIWVGGKIEARGKRGEGHYVVNKDERNFSKLFVLSLLEFLVVDRKVLIVNEDNTLSMKDFE